MDNKKFFDFKNYYKEKMKEIGDGLAGIRPPDENTVRPPAEKESKSKPLPYKAAEDEDLGKIFVADQDDVADGLAYKFTPGMKDDQGCDCKTPVPDVKKVKAKKLTTESFLKKTKNLDKNDFVQFVLSESKVNSEISTVTDLMGNAFTPDPVQSIQYVCGIILSNGNMMERFVTEIKRRAGMDMLVEELMDHGESYQSLVYSLDDPANGKERCSKLAGHFHDAYNSLLDGFDDPSTKDIYDMDADQNESVSAPLEDFDFVDDVEQGQEKQPEQDVPQNQGNPQVPNVGEKKMSAGTSSRKPKYYGECAAMHMINELSNYPPFKDHMHSKLK